MSEIAKYVYEGTFSVLPLLKFTDSLLTQLAQRRQGGVKAAMMICYYNAREIRGVNYSSQTLYNTKFWSAFTLVKYPEIA